MTSNITVDPSDTFTPCANCSGDATADTAWTACRRDGGCSCACHLGSAQVEQCEFETEPFTADERGALSRYNCRVLGIPDCFDAPSLEGIPPEFSVGDVILMFRSYYKMLRDWRGAIRDLRADLEDLGLHHAEPIHNPHGEAHRIVPLSLAAQRYLQIEMTDWKNAQEGHRTLVAEYFLGHDEHGDEFDYAAVHHGCELTDLGFMFAEHP